MYKSDGQKEMVFHAIPLSNIYKTCINKRLSQVHRPANKPIIIIQLPPRWGLGDNWFAFTDLTSRTVDCGLPFLFVLFWFWFFYFLFFWVLIINQWIEAHLVPYSKCYNIFIVDCLFFVIPCIATRSRLAWLSAKFKHGRIFCCHRCVATLAITFNAFLYGYARVNQLFSFDF